MLKKSLTVYQKIRKNKSLNDPLYITLFFVLGLTITFRYFFVIYKVQGHSMKTTFYNGDKILVDKRFKLFTHDPYLIKLDDGSTFVKRLVGMPGQVISITNNGIYINNKELENFTINEERDLVLEHLNSSQILAVYGKEWSRDKFGPLLIPEKGTQISLKCDSSIVYKHIIIAENLIESEREWDDFKASKDNYTFLNNYYFYIGDNFYHSQDSRTKGLISEKNIFGKVLTTLVSRK